MAKNEPKNVRVMQIIDSAVLEFVEKGYEGTSMASIAKRAGLTKGGLYHHFNSKDEILIEANNRYLEPVLGLMAEANQNPSSKEGLKVYIAKYLTHWSTHPRELVFTFLSMAKMLSCRDMWSGMNSYVTFMKDFYEQLLVKGKSEGEFRDHDSAGRAVALMSAMDGVTGSLVMCEDMTPKSVADHFIHHFIDDIEL